MLELDHINCGWLHSPPIQPACCHCLLVREDERSVLIDTGIGLLDIDQPEKRVGIDAIAAAGFKFLPSVAAATQLRARNIQPESVTDIVLTHCDPDHAGGLSDFPCSTVHLSAEELTNIRTGNPRYREAQFEHEPRWVTYAENDSELFGIPARRVKTSIDADIRLVPLFGHTLGHCGVAIFANGRWVLHVGDAYYLRDELTDPKHPIDALASHAADDNGLRQSSLELLRELSSRDDIELELNGYHDTNELPSYLPAYTDCM